MVAESLIVASEVIGFISFFFTLLTWLGVYISVIKTFRSAPTEVPIILGNIRQELLEERSLLRQRIRDGDTWHVFRGRETRKQGNTDSQVHLLDVTLKVTWRAFRDIEKRFQMQDSQDEELGGSQSQSDQDEKGGRLRRMRERRNHLNYMGMTTAGLSIDNRTYYNTNMRHRLLWWWLRDDVTSLANRLARLQTRRIEADIYETNELVKRGMEMFGDHSGENVYVRRAAHPPHRRRSRKIGRNGSQSERRSSFGVREIYEREFRRVRPSSPDRSRSVSVGPPRKVAGSNVSVRRRTPSVVEYDIVDPGRVWVDVENARSANGRRIQRPAASHHQSYVRERRHDTDDSD